ncbi:amidohydrolase [Herbiconiux sp.]|uniref:amidohydrolase n=1 Tax=Herbiconiux sp. TaxID=1871186 RepID=UPI0025C21DDC|nr:amidohydrolase [Herbiconiux sp.]
MFDTIYVGGRAFTAGWDASRALGVGVRDGRIAAVAADDELRAAGAAEVVELRGGLVLPAFHDAHAHPIAGAVELLQCDLAEAVDADDCLARIERYAASLAEDEWVLGGGWSMPHFPGGTPTRQQLDRVVGGRPVMLHNRDHHGVWVSTRTLELAGITALTEDPADGRIEREADGFPSGVLHEGAVQLIDDVVPGTSPELAARALDRAQSEFFARGLSGWQDAWVGRTAGVDDLLDTYVAAVQDGTLRARITAALWWERDGGLAQLAGLRERRARVEALGRPDLLIADTVKIMVDGVAENFTAALSEPYRDACGHTTGNSGLTFLSPADLTEAVVALDAEGFVVHFHALGDRAVTLALDALEAARAANGVRASRHHLAHLQLVQSSDVPRFAALEATANLQMLWGAVDDQLDELTFPFIDPRLVGRHYPFRELRDAGARLAAGSDWPVSTQDPIEAVHIAVNRAAPGDEPDDRIRTDQALDLSDALAAYTAGSAFVGGRSGMSGALVPGLAADLVVLDADPFAVPRDELHRVRVRETRVAGECVYSAEGDADAAGAS